MHTSRISIRRLSQHHMSGSGGLRTSSGLCTSGRAVLYTTATKTTSPASAATAARKSCYFITLENRVNNEMTSMTLGRTSGPSTNSLLLSDITVAWDLGLINSLQCLALLQKLLGQHYHYYSVHDEDPLSMTTSTSTSTLHSIFISYLHVASFFYRVEENSHHTISKPLATNHNWFKGVKSIHHPPSSHASASLLTNLFDFDEMACKNNSGLKTSRALDHLTSFLLNNKDNQKELVNELFNLLFATTSTTTCPLPVSIVTLQSALAKKYADLIIAFPQFTCSALWIKLIENLRKERGVPPSLWISILYSVLVHLNTHNASFFSSSSNKGFLLDDGLTGWREILSMSFQDSSATLYPLLQKMLEMSTQYPYSLYDYLLAGLLHQREHEKLVETCMFLLRSNDPELPSISPLVFGTIVQHLFKVKENKKAILLLHHGLEERLSLPLHLIPTYPSSSMTNNLDHRSDETSHSNMKTKRLSLFRHQKLFERVVVGLALGSFTTLSLSLLETAGSSLSSLQKSSYMYNGLIMAFLRPPSRDESQSLLKKSKSPPPPSSRRKPRVEVVQDHRQVIVSRLLSDMKREGIDMHSYTKYAFIQHLISQGLEEKAIEYLVPLLTNGAAAAHTNGGDSREKQADFYALIPKYGLQVPGLCRDNGDGGGREESQMQGMHNVDLILQHMIGSNRPITTSFFNSFLGRLLKVSPSLTLTFPSPCPAKESTTTKEAKEEDFGVMQHARKLFENMKEDWRVDRDQHTFSIMANAEFQRGNIDLGLVYVRQALQETLADGGSGMSACLYSLACCALVEAGRVEESLLWFTRMTGLSVLVDADHVALDAPKSFSKANPQILLAAEKNVYTPMIDSVGLENYFTALIKSGNHRLLFSLFSQHGASYCRVLRPAAIAQVIDYLLEAKKSSYLTAITWSLFLEGSNLPLVASLLEKAFRVHLSSCQVQGDQETWKGQTESFVANLDESRKELVGDDTTMSGHQRLIFTILCLLHQSFSAESQAPVSNTRILLQIALLECIRREKQIHRFQVGDSGIKTLFSRLPVFTRPQQLSIEGGQLSSPLQQHATSNWQLPELAEIGAAGVNIAFDSAIFSNVNGKEKYGPLVGDLLQIRKATNPLENSSIEDEQKVCKAENQVSPVLEQTQGKRKREIDRLRHWCAQKNFDKVEAALERILFPHSQQDGKEHEHRNPIYLFEYLDLMIYHKLTVSGLECDDSPSLVIDYLLSQDIKGKAIPPKFIGTWFATATKRYLSSPDLGSQIYEQSIEKLGMDRQAVSRQIIRQLAASYQPEAAQRFYQETMRPAGLALDFEAYQELITAHLHQDNISQVLAYFGPLLKFDFSSGKSHHLATSSANPLTVLTVKLEGAMVDTLPPKSGQMKDLVWKVMSVFMKMKKIHSQSICNLLQTIYFEAALQDIEPKGKNLQLLVDHLIRQGQVWSMALIPYLDAPLQKPRYAEVVKIMQSTGVVKRAVRFNNSVLQEFEKLVHSLFAEGGALGLCAHPTQLKIVWACVHLMQHLNWNGLKRPGEYVDLASIVLTEFVRLQLPGSRIPSSLGSAASLVVKGFFAQCRPYFVKWDTFPTCHKAAVLGSHKQVEPLPPPAVSSATRQHRHLAHHSQQKQLQSAEQTPAIKLMPPLSEVLVGSLPKPATFTSVLDSTLPLVGNTLWLYNRIKRGATASSQSSSGSGTYTFREQYALSLVKENKDIPITLLIQRNPDLEKELEWVSGL